jgi:integrase
MAKKDRVAHHKALPFPKVGEFLARLRGMPGAASRCLEFTILTAARTNEATQAKPEEFDLDNATWTIPEARMKAKKEHRVPLSPRALEIVRELLNLKGDFLFPGAKRGKPISNMAMLTLLERMDVDATTHGFRSSFRDWAKLGPSF